MYWQGKSTFGFILDFWNKVDFFKNGLSLDLPVLPGQAGWLAIDKTGHSFEPFSILPFLVFMRAFFHLYS